MKGGFVALFFETYRFDLSNIVMNKTIITMNGKMEIMHIINYKILN